MSILNMRLDKAEEMIKKPSFRQNKGLGNEVGYYVFDYPAEEEMQDTIDHTQGRDQTAAQKRKEKLVKQLKEAKDYDAKIAHIALARVDIDLDDGVKVNYEKVQKGQDGKNLGILAKI